MEDRLFVTACQRRCKFETASLALAIAAFAAIGAALYGHLAADVAVVLCGRLGASLAAIGFVGLTACLILGHAWWRVLAASGSSYLLLAAAWARFVPHLRAPQVWLTWSVATSMLILGAAFVAGVLNHRIRALCKHRSIAADLEHGTVEQYVGTLRTAHTDLALRRLGRLGLIDLSHSAAHRLELLPRSGMILRADGRAPRHLELAHVVDVAPSPPHAYRTALPEGVAPRDAPAKVQLQRRSLSSAERDELAAHIRRLRRPYWPAVGVVLASLVVLAVRLSMGMAAREIVDVPFMAWLGLTVVACAAYIRRIREARRLEYDRQLRWVVTVEDRTPSHTDPSPPKLEVLPFSQLAWTENAAPAGWRVARLP